MTAIAIAHGGTDESVLQSGRYGANGSKNLSKRKIFDGIEHKLRVPLTKKQ